MAGRARPAGMRRRDDPDGEEPCAGEEQRSESIAAVFTERGAPFAERAVEPREGEQQFAGRQDAGGRWRTEGREEEIFHRPEFRHADVAPVPDEAVEILEGPPEHRADREEEEEAAGLREHQARPVLRTVNALTSRMKAIHRGVNVCAWNRPSTGTGSTEEPGRPRPAHRHPTGKG